MHVLSVITVVLSVSAAMPSTTAQGSDPCSAMQCSTEFSPVCSTNGITYENECLFSSAKCREQQITPTTELSIASTGVCPTPVPSVTDAAASEPEADPCSAMQCSTEFSPVCGTNGITYENECFFSSAKCRELHTTGSDQLTIASTGSCATPTPSAINAPSAGPTSLPCGITCEFEEAPVCGSNGITYANACYLQQVNCGIANASGGGNVATIKVASEGMCGLATVQPAALD